MLSLRLTLCNFVALGKSRKRLLALDPLAHLFGDPAQRRSHLLAHPAMPQGNPVRHGQNWLLVSSV